MTREPSPCHLIIQNRLGYAVLIVGIMMASLLLIFGMGMKPLMDSFRADIENTQIAKYQYVLKAKAKTDVKGAEKYCVNTLNYQGKEDIMAYGIKEESAYVKDIKLPDEEGTVLISSGFAIIVYVLLLYLLAKMIIDKNSQNISMLKILGYTSREAGGIYSKATAIVVVCALIFTLPLSERLMRVLYYYFMKDMNGWLTYYLPAWLFVLIPAIGIVCYFFIHLLLTKKVRHVGLAHALRSME